MINVPSVAASTAAAPVTAPAAPAAPRAHLEIAAHAPPLTSTQQAGLAQLHAVAQQFESLFVNMLFKSMRAASPQTSISGEKESSAESTFSEMLDAKRSESIAKTGSFGIAKILENQLRNAVLANPEQAARARLGREGIL